MRAVVQLQMQTFAVYHNEEPQSATPAFGKALFAFFTLGVRAPRRHMQQCGKL